MLVHRLILGSIKMKINKKLVVVFMVSLLSVLCIVGLTSCDNGECKHEWGEWETVKEATCETKGKEVRVCKLDPTHTEEKTTALTDHLYGDDYRWSVAWHSPMCTVCGGYDEEDEELHVSSGPATTEAAEVCTICGYEIAPKLIEEKQPVKVLFLGNSFVYMGLSVIEKKQTVLTIGPRQHDKGYFYQLCQANGFDVDVTNWTFGGHRLDQLFMEKCNCDRDCYGKNHLKNLTDKYYDYVIASPGSGTKSAEGLIRDFEYITDFFRAENPDVKIICCGNMSATGYTADPEYRNPEIYNQYQVLEDMGILVADWGGVAKRLMTGEYSTGTGKYDYYNHTFVISKDDYHPSQLSGYITTLMLYCVITGESAIGQPYDFCGNGYLNDLFDFDTYIKRYYTKGGTNYPEIFADSVEMAAIQYLVDQHIQNKPYRTVE